MFTSLDRMREVEVSLREPWRAPGIRVAKRNRPSRRILGHTDPLVAAEDVHGLGDSVREQGADINVRSLRAALVGGLENTERCGHALPRYLVIDIALERIRTISRQGSVV